MSNKTGDTKRGRGRPPIEKVKLKSSPRYAVEDYNKKYKNESVCCVYGIDEFTLLLLESLWLNPEILFYVTDPNPTILANVNRNFSQRSMSMYRWHVSSCSDFISKPPNNLMIVSSKHIDQVKKLHNPENVEFIVLEEL
jgi:hypothetical protein